jgi:hypothetical protein
MISFGYWLYPYRLFFRERYATALGGAIAAAYDGGVQSRTSIFQCRKNNTLK